MRLLRRALDGGPLAFTFLTILPLPTSAEAVGLDSAPAWFPLVGAAIGALAGGVYVGAHALFGAPPAAVLAAITLVVVTGALHQDALADCADGLGVRGERTRRLEVMRDSRIGVFGALAVVSWMLLAVASLEGLTPTAGFRALVIAGALARWTALMHATALPSARSDGLGAAFTVPTMTLFVATLVAVFAALAIVPVTDGLGALATVLVVTALVSGWAKHTLGGRTGDTLGACVALNEVAVLLVLLAFARG